MMLFKLTFSFIFFQISDVEIELTTFHYDVRIFDACYKIRSRFTENSLE